MQYHWDQEEVTSFQTVISLAENKARGTNYSDNHTSLNLTLTLSMFSGSESISRSPTGSHASLTISACLSCPSSRSSASWSSTRRSKASSSLLCQSSESVLSRSHLVITSSASLRRTRPTFWARSSGLISEGYRKNKSLCPLYVKKTTSGDRKSSKYDCPLTYCGTKSSNHTKLLFLCLFFTPFYT